MTRREWEAWKERNAWWWDWVTLPVAFVAIGILQVYRLIIWVCKQLGIKPPRLP